MATLIPRLLETWVAFWPHFMWASIILIGFVLAAHAILTKKDTRSTIAWVGLILFSPVVGAVAYVIFGVNRIRSRAARLRAGTARVRHDLAGCEPSPARLDAALGPEGSPLRSLSYLVERVTDRPLTDCNSIEPLEGGDEAYPAMLEAIARAKRSVGIASYIFDNDPTGREFVAALGAAVERGVAVRVLVDGIGASYSHPAITGRLAEAEVPWSTFLPTSVPFYFAYANLRNHRARTSPAGSASAPTIPTWAGSVW